MLLVFFFSSRRRHTRCLSDWSSDVCSSDLAWVNPALSSVAAGKPFEFSATVRNEDRSLGARLSGELALLRAQQRDLKPDIHFRLRGTAGQSFGSFASQGMKLVLEGQANDFVGK